MTVTLRIRTIKCDAQGKVEAQGGQQQAGSADGVYDGLEIPTPIGRMRYEQIVKTASELMGCQS